MPSESIAELPEKKAAMSFVAAIARLPAIAAKIATLDSSVMGDTITNQRKIQNRKRVSRGSVLLCELCGSASLREALFLAVDNSRKGAKPQRQNRRVSNRAKLKLLLSQQMIS